MNPPAGAVEALNAGRGAAILERGGRATFAVVGDFMLDRYLVGEAARISPEAPVPVIRLREETVRPGGAGNVAWNLAALGAGVVPFGVVGRDPDAERLQACLRDAGIGAGGLTVDPGRVTTVKTRILAEHHPVARLDREEDAPVPDGVAAEILERIESALPDLSAILLADYDKGVLTDRTVPAVLRLARSRGIPVFVDPKPANLPLYRGADLLTPNHQEACAAVGWSAAAGDRDLPGLGRRLLARVECRGLLITRGKRGMLVCEPGKDPVELPAVAREVFDVTGAGDTVVAVAAVALLGGGSLMEAARLSSLAAARVVGRVGTAAVRREEILADLAGLATPLP
ncbi:MAG: D-glycero-beta-D-manno-heptose-7-phosphate kinase [Acidobacteria bacterium]|nr:D-glycero-beta-D-manno-heptose-7-phosphate kinase [Acidobacteriota bacterium]